MPDIFVDGFIMGFSIAAPVGPIGLLCIKRSLTKGKQSGFASGLGAATADGIYGLIAALGLTGISTILLGYQSVLQLLGGIFLLYLGVRILLSHPKEDIQNENSTSLFRDYTSTLLLTLSNPITIISFVGVFAGLGLASVENEYAIYSILLVSGVFLGSAFWWLILSTTVSLFQKRLNLRVYRLINLTSGVIIIGFALRSLYETFIK